MKIAIISPLWERVPPAGYGGTELVIYYTAKGLAKRGHKVFLYASGDSKVAGVDLRVVTEKHLASQNVNDEELRNFHLLNIKKCIKDRNKFDIIDNHLVPDALPFLAEIKKDIPSVSTIHSILHKGDPNKVVYDKYRNENFISISNAYRKIIPNLNYVDTIYHGIDLDEFKFTEKNSDDLIMIGRFSKAKGFHVGIDLAIRNNKKIKLAAPELENKENQNLSDYKYFKTDIKPKLTNPLVNYVGEVQKDGKSKFYNAKALLLPIDREEPFGLVIIEAMACGTPVVAFSRGSVPELVKDGETGFIVEANNVDAMGQAIERIYKMPKSQYQNMRKNCRKHVEENFTVDKMVDSYEKLYQKLINN